MTVLVLELQGGNKTRPTHQRTDANLYPLERQLTKASEPSFDLEGGGHLVFQNEANFSPREAYPQ